MSNLLERARPFVLMALLVALPGCLIPKAPHPSLQQVKARLAPPPDRSAGLPGVEKAHVQRGLIPSEAGNLQTGWEKKFAAAREASWNRDAATMEQLLRELLAAERSPGRKEAWQMKLVESSEADGRWDEAVARLKEFGFDKRHPGWLAHDRSRASVPRMEVRFETGAGELPFDLRFGQLVRCRVRINGVDAVAMVDTGFSISMVTEKFARRAGVEILRQEIPMHDINGSTRQERLALVKEMEFGGMRARQVTVMTGNERFLSMMFGEVDAVIGWDLLQRADVTWDFPAGRMKVVAPEGPMAAKPVLGGRRSPLITVRSAEGREMEWFLDTGFGPYRPNAALVENAGLLFTRVDRRQVRRNWMPTFTLGMNSFRLRWERRIEPFRFWFGGHEFELGHASVRNVVDVREGWQTCDGMVGNAPFLKGRLRLCATRRLAEFALAEKPAR
jgi:hypothetical protein